MRKLQTIALALSLMLQTYATTQAACAQAKGSSSKLKRMDLAFCIDTTGSMQGEIDTVKAKVKELVAKLSQGKQGAMVRVGLVAYRDKGDEYVTKVFPFTDDIDKVVKDISGLKADGGGDGPEAVDEGLKSSVNGLAWSNDSRAVKLLFLIGDAGPHQGAKQWQDYCKQAINKGIQVNTIGCHGLENYPAEDGKNVFAKIAQLTDGRFEALSYRTEVAGADGKKSTIVTAGGASYSVASADKDAWKKEISALKAKGIVKEMRAAKPMLAFPTASPAGGSMGFLPKESRADTMMEAKASAYRGRSASFRASAPVIRADNNLDDLLLRQAKNAAQKAWKVDIK